MTTFKEYYNNRMLQAFSFIVQSVEDIWYVFCTPMSSTEDTIVVDIWCPENPIFTTRASFSKNDNLIASVQYCILRTAQQNHINTNNFTITNTSIPSRHDGNMNVI